MKKDSSEKLTGKYLKKIDTPTFVDMLYFSTRYAIGRLSIASQMLPCDIVEIFKNNKKLLEKHLDNYFGDLNREINARLNMIGIDNVSITSKENYFQILCSEIYQSYINNNFENIGNDIFTSYGSITSDLLKKLYEMIPWCDLVSAFNPSIEVTLDDNIVFDAFYSIDSDKHVAIKTCEHYLKEPHYSIFLVDKNIKTIKFKNYDRNNT